MAAAAATSATAGGPGAAEPQEACGWRCPEHSDREAELFCRRCRRCVCALCPVLGAHRGHPVRLALEEVAHVQRLTQDCLKQLATKKQQEADNITQIEDAAEKLKAHAESSKAWLAGKFTELRLLLDEEEALAKKYIDKNTQLALQVYRQQTESCGEHIDAMNDLSHRVYSISQEPDPIRLLQAYSAAKQEMERQMSLGELCHPVPLSFEPVKSLCKGFVEAVQAVLQMPLEARLKAPRMDCQLSCSSSTKPGTLLKTGASPERSLFLKYARTPTLEPDTMHARLRLSADRLTVRCGLLGRLGPAPAVRFDALWQCFRFGFLEGTLDTEL
ncbi:tripartite motif-containing protein 14 [Orycteropus afer afer]|uniref:Tripartite motif-containing protein 14 n=1 Tax=Orycteropus afer afer TaxID=1230840 RepID=A0AC54ZF99_ORYAF|nr:tripartite motif-containing protein 14 [Orycteropus afer afer]